MQLIYNVWVVGGGGQYRNCQEGRFLGRLVFGPLWGSSREALEAVRRPSERLRKTLGCSKAFVILVICTSLLHP